MVRGDSGYRFPLADGSGFDVSEYGIKPGDFQQGATIAALTIDGGEGSDRLFGGALADHISGGAGTDYIAGGGGDDVIDGGSGADLLVGDTGLEPDRFEFVTRDGADATNDSLSFAALLDELTSGSTNVVNDLSLSLGDMETGTPLRPRRP